ncbi:MAG: ABC transporter permease [Rhodothermales bacterium]
MFDLEKAIATWRGFHLYRRAISGDDLDELEQHLRDQVAALVAEGHGVEAAYRRALGEMGDGFTAETEYRKVYWGKVRRRHGLAQEIIGRMLMVRNWFKLALRNAKRHPGYTLINVGGLALGLSCCFLIVLFVQHELSYDRYHAKADRIVRLIYGSDSGDDAGEWAANSAAGYAPFLTANLPEIEAAVRIENFRSPYVALEDGQRRRLEGLALADPTLFEVFDFTFLRGDPATALQDNHAVVLTQHAAEALFGRQDPIGRSIRYGDRYDLTVSAVIADMPDASHFHFNAVASFRLLEDLVGPTELEGFTNYNYNTYFLLRPDVDRQALEAKITAAMRERFNADRAPDDEGSRYVAGLQPLTAIHLTNDLAFDYAGHRDVRYLIVFGIIGALILLIACVNFMNLATARAVQRASEVGVRKAVGAVRSQIVGQFIGESVLMSVLAIGIGMVLAALALPVFNEAVNGTASFSLARLGTIGLLVTIGLAAGVLAGSYPAFYLSAFLPARVLKGDLARGGGATLLRKGLIVFQFATSVFLMVATATVYRQLNYMQERDLGFSKEQVVFLSPPGAVIESYETFRQELLSDPSIEQVALTGGLPGRVNTNRGYNWPGQTQEGDQEGASFWTGFADPDYFDVLGMTLVAGRTFSREVPTDTNDTYVLNETAVRQLGWSPEEAVGQPFRAWDRPMGTVIGVVKDFHFQSLHQPVESLVLNYKPTWMGTVALRTKAGALPAAIAHLQTTWNAFSGGFPLEYRFLDEDFDRLYQNEARLGSLFAFFAAIAVFIACLGLFGLAAYAAQQRTKEIGVRKVLGASVRSLVLLLSKEFVGLVAVALVVAVPASYLAMQRWLDGFAYHTGIGVWIYLAAGAVALGIAFATVSTQAMRVAQADPVKSLRYE